MDGRKEESVAGERERESVCSLIIEECQQVSDAWIGGGWNA
jgi:hypothetical protein